MSNTNRVGWRRLGIVLSVAWLIGVSIYAAWEYRSVQDSLDNSVLLPELSPQLPQGWQLYGQQTFLTECKIENKHVFCSPRVVNLFTLALLPVSLVWILIILLVRVFLWVRSGFRGRNEI